MEFIKIEAVLACTSFCISIWLEDSLALMPKVTFLNVDLGFEENSLKVLLNPKN